MKLDHHSSKGYLFFFNINIQQKETNLEMQYLDKMRTKIFEEKPHLEILGVLELVIAIL